MLSNSTMLLACAEGLPAASFTFAVTVRLPLARPETFTSDVQTPLASTTAVPVTVPAGAAPSDTVKETVPPTATPELVPETVKVLSSSALTLLSPSNVPLIARVGANMSTDCVLRVATMLGLFAASIAAFAATSTVTFPSNPAVGVTTNV